MISVVICSIDARKFNAVCAQYRQALAGEPSEIIGVQDAQSLCEGYNRGLAASRGEIVIFSHDDLEILTPDFTRRLKAHLAAYDVVGVAGTDRVVGPAWFSAGIPHTFGQVAHTLPDGALVVNIFGVPRRVIGGIQALDGLFIAFRRPVVERLGWDAASFTGFHGYDMDMTFRAHLAGYRLAVAADLPLLHLKLTGDFGAEWQRFAQVFVAKHQRALGSAPGRACDYAAVKVATREEAAAVMKTIYEATER